MKKELEAINFFDSYGVENVRYADKDSPLAGQKRKVQVVEMTRGEKKEIEQHAKRVKVMLRRLGTFVDFPL